MNDGEYQIEPNTILEANNAEHIEFLAYIIYCGLDLISREEWDDIHDDDKEFAITGAKEVLFTFEVTMK